MRRPEAVAALFAAELRSPRRARRDRVRLGAVAAIAAAPLPVAVAVWWALPDPRLLDAPALSTLPQRRSSTAPRLSIVVLPFTNLSNDPRPAIFC